MMALRRISYLVSISISLLFIALVCSASAALAAGQVEQLTFRGVNGEAYFSPDGSKLIFQSYERKAHAHTQAYILDLTTKKLQRVSRHLGDDTCTWFHPSKSGVVLYSSTHDEIVESHKYRHYDPRVVAKRKAAAIKKAGGKKKWDMQRRRRRYKWMYKPYEIYLFSTKGKVLKRLTHSPGYDAEASISPDGKKVLFSSRRDGDQELYIMNIDGSGQRRLTWRRGNDGGPFFSPTGKQITWRSFDKRGNAQVFVADLRNDALTNIRQLTHGKGIHWAPFWHPNGKWLVFSSNHETTYKNRRNFDLYLVDVAGTCVHKLTTHPSADVLPVFSPDGKWLAFTSKRVGGKSQLFRMPFQLPAKGAKCVDPRKSKTTAGLLSFRKPSAHRKHGHGHARSYRHYRRYRKYRHYRKYRKHKGHHHARKHHHHRTYKHHHAHAHKKAPTSRPTSRPVKARSRSLSLKDAKAALVRDVHFLSHPLLEGRDAGTKGIELAARYIAHAFKASGLSGAFAKKGYFQTYSVTTGVQAGAKNSLTVTSGKQSASFQKTVQFVPFGFSKSGKVKAKVAFVGFGITDPASGYDDYKGIDVKGKIVLMLRYTPRWWSKTKHMFGRRKSLYAAFRYKLLNARSKGALGVILVDLPRRAKEKPGPLVSLRLTRGLSDAGIVAVHAREAVANQILGKGRFSALVNQIEEALKPRSFVTNAVVELQVELQKKQARIKNVAAMVPGTDPVLRKEVVVVGAHYDHLGYGHVGAFSGNQGKIHPGADDNASGTSVMLTMARAFARKPAKRTMLFVAFSGEERGLLGSAYFVKHSPIPLSRMVTMVNLDMVGQMKGRRMVVQGSMTSPTFVPVLEGLARRHHLQVKLGPSGYGPSDHTSFYARKIPVLFFFTGAHPRYHRPNDVFSSLNLEGMFRVYKYVSDVTRRISMSSRRPSYRKVLSPLPRRKARGGMRAYLGSIPDYGSQRKNGVKLTGVRAGGPADKGGIKGGDVLLKMGRFGLKNLYDMVFALRYYRPGDTIVVEVLRGGKRLKLRVKLGQRRSYRR